MAKQNRTAYVVWDRQFDEIGAAIFVVTFRQMGLGVKVVGLNQRIAKGWNGLALRPDLTLERALRQSAQVDYLIFPCRTPVLNSLQRQPLLSSLLKQQQSGCRIVVGDQPQREDSLFKQVAEQNLFIYPNVDNLSPFARQLAELNNGE